MYKDIDIAEAQVYVGTYRKYNEGSIFGEWLQLADYNNISEFYEACASLHHDEDDPEFMFQDYENIPQGLINESWISFKIFDLLDEVQMLSTSEQEAFFIWCNNKHADFSKEGITDLVADFENDFIGEYNSEEDFARELVQETHNLSDFAEQYFDYEAYARDLFIDSYWFDGGYVFSR